MYIYSIYVYILIYTVEFSSIHSAVDPSAASAATATQHLRSNAVRSTSTGKFSSCYMGVSENSVPHCTQWFC